MAWTASKVFRIALADIFTATSSVDLDTDSFKAALFNNTITPNQDVAAATAGYNSATSQWVTSGEVIDTTGGGTDWPAGGKVLVSPVVNVGTAGVVFWDAVDTVSGTTCDLANATGALVYDDTATTPVADPGVCYNWFGGANTVVNGTFTIIWNANGIMRATL